MNFYNLHKKGILFGLACTAIALPLLLTAWTPVIYSFTEFFILNATKISDLFFSWQLMNFGQTGANGLWRLAPLDTFYYFFNYVIHLPTSLTHALFLALICVSGFIAFYFFMKEVFPRVSYVPRIIGGLMFIFNLYNQLNLSTSFLFAVVYLALPLQLFLFLKGLRTKRYLLYGLLLALVNAGTFGINLAYSAIAVGVLISFGIWQVFVIKETQLREVLKVLSLTGIFSLLLILWWLAPMIYANLVDRKTTDFVLQSESFQGLDSTMLNVFRNLGDWSFFSGYRGEPYHVFAYLYKEIPLIVVSSYMVPILILAALVYFSAKSIKPKNSRNQILVFFLLSVALLPVIGGTNSAWPTHNLADWVFAHVPFAMVFRSTYKFTEVVAFSYVVILTVFLDESFTVPPRRRRRQQSGWG